MVRKTEEVTEAGTIVTYFDEIMDEGIGKQVTPYVRFYPDDLMVVGKYIGKYYSIAITLTSDDALVLLHGLGQEYKRYLLPPSPELGVEEDSEGESNNSDLDIFDDFLKDK
jgi:hypothetical protein